MAQLPSKQDFVRYIKRIQDCIEYDAECRKAADRHHIDYSETDASELAYYCVDLLGRLFNCYHEDCYGDIDYFCFEVGFGKSCGPDEFEYFRTAENLYDYLLSRVKGE